MEPRLRAAATATTIAMATTMAMATATTTAPTRMGGKNRKVENWMKE